MGALANYKSYSYLKYSIYTNKVIPIGLYAVRGIYTRNDFFNGVYVAKGQERKYLRRAAAGGCVGEVVARKL